MSPRAEVLEGSSQSSAMRKPVLAGPKFPCLHVFPCYGLRSTFLVWKNHP